MDFSFTEEQEAVRDLAGQIFEGQATVERVREVEAADERFDRDLWAELAKADLLGLVAARGRRRQRPRAHRGVPRSSRSRAGGGPGAAVGTRCARRWRSRRFGSG